MPTMPASSHPWNTATFSAIATRLAAPIQSIEMPVLGATICVEELRPRHVELGPQLCQREHLPHLTLHPGSRCARQRSRVRPRSPKMLPPRRGLEVDELGRERSDELTSASESMASQPASVIGHAFLEEVIHRVSPSVRRC